MAVAAVPSRARRSARWHQIRRGAAGCAARLLSPARPVAANLAAIPFTVAGWGLIAAGVFAVSTVAGLIVSGVILMVLEHQIADEP